MGRRLGIAFAILLLLTPRSEAQSKRGISFVSPPDGATVAGPQVYVHLAFENIKAVPAGGIVRPGEGHAHILIDRDPVGHGENLPTDQPNIVHLGKPPLLERSIEVGLGRHRLVAQLGNSAHKAMGASTAEITVNVVPGFRGRGALSPACAEVASGTGEVRIAFPNEGGHLQGSITSACTFTTDGGACRWQSVSDRRVFGSYNAGTHALTGTTGGTTARQLMGGEASRCGRGSIDSLDEIPFAAAFADGAVTGTFGQARFTVRSDPSVALEGVVAAANAPSPTRQPSSSRGLIATVLVVVVLAALVFTARRRRRRSASVVTPAPVTVPPVPEPMATGGPPTQAEDVEGACPECGAERRPGLRFCTHCGHHF